MKLKELLPLFDEQLTLVIGYEKWGYNAWEPEERDYLLESHGEEIVNLITKYNGDIFIELGEEEWSLKNYCR